MKTETVVPAVVEKTPATLEGMSTMNTAPTPEPVKTIESDPAMAITAYYLSITLTERLILMAKKKKLVKNIERLEQISDERNEQRKLEEEDDTDEEDTIKFTMHHYL